MTEHNVSLKPYNTFGMDVNAAVFATFQTVHELKWMLSQPEYKKLPLLILGGGSNVLLTKNFPGLVLKNDLKGIQIVKQEGNTVYIKAAGGENWHDLVLFCIEKGFGGIENMSLIPGSVGAAPMQNIGAYGVEIKDVFHELTALEISSQHERVFSKDECQFGYRESIFKRDLKGLYIILNVTLKLNITPILNTTYGAIKEELTKAGINQPTPRDVSNAVIAIRKSKLPDPKDLGNSGSFFKNPVVLKAQYENLKKTYPEIPGYPEGEFHTKLAAGWLIEKAGWKGKTIGHCGVHKNQALVLVNYGGAIGSEIFKLSEEILQSVKEKFGVELEREVNVI